MTTEQLERFVEAQKLHTHLRLAVRALQWFLEELHDDADIEEQDWTIWGADLALWGLAESLSKQPERPKRAPRVQAPRQTPAQAQLFTEAT